MNVLIACEYSGIVREAFTKKGHYAVSCDILPTEMAGVHHLGDIREVMHRQRWDMIIAFPPCTHLSSAGAQLWKQKQADGRQKEAIDFFMLFINNSCAKISIENPSGIMNTKYRKPDQIINPFQFGDPFKKRTCLWLKGLPKLIPTNIVEPTHHFTSNSTRGGLLKDGTRKKSQLPILKAWDTGKERSKTFQGIANAMAEQWG